MIYPYYIIYLFTVLPQHAVQIVLKMELTRENVHSIIYYDFGCGSTQQQCMERLISAFGDEAP